MKIIRNNKKYLISGTMMKIIYYVKKRNISTNAVIE